MAARGEASGVSGPIVYGNQSNNSIWPAVIVGAVIVVAVIVLGLGPKKPK
jgi:hypothetical protein